jgi:hypothetical protein
MRAGWAAGYKTPSQYPTPSRSSPLSLATRSAAAARGVRPGLHAELVPASRLRALVDESAATPAFRPPHVKLGPLPGSKELDALLRRGDPAGAAAPAPVVPAKNPGDTGSRRAVHYLAVECGRQGQGRPHASGRRRGLDRERQRLHGGPLGHGHRQPRGSMGVRQRGRLGDGVLARLLQPGAVRLGFRRGWYGTIDEGEVGDIFGRDYVVCGLYTRSSAGGR